MQKSIIEILNKYPLADHWEKPEQFDYLTKVDDLEISLLGFSAKNKVSGQTVTASSGGLQTAEPIRAYFELLERIAVIDNINNLKENYIGLNNKKVQTKNLDLEEVFPTSTNESVWKYALSNGVAAHTDWPLAAENAKFEIIERDLILKSWYGIHEPELIENFKTDVLSKLSKSYQIKTYLLAEEHPYKSIGVFGFPLKHEAPFFYGFGSSQTLEIAFDKAFSEAIQRLGFLWGEEIPKEVPPLAPTAFFHQEYFLLPESHNKILSWLNGNHYSEKIKLVYPALTTDIYYIDLTPDYAQNDWFAVKAISESRLKLKFGMQLPNEIIGLTDVQKNELLIHPIA